MVFILSEVEEISNCKRHDIESNEQSPTIYLQVVLHCKLHFCNFSIYKYHFDVLIKNFMQVYKRIINQVKYQHF